MEVLCEMMKLKPERVKDYVDLHNHTWPELVVEMRACGILEEYVYILDNLVVVIMKAESFSVTNARLAKCDVFTRWDVEVRPMMLIEPSFTHTADGLVDLHPTWRLDNFDAKGVLTAKPI